jgi:hypothetical protein
MRDLKPVYIESRSADSYPSGSTISYFDDRFYVMGDDAAEILVLDETMRELDRITIFTRGESARLPKAFKADIESSLILSQNGTDSILFLGSGSVSPHRDSAFLFNPKTKAVRRMDMSAFYAQLREHFSDLNIEAATSVGNSLLLGVRANGSHPDNYLVFANLIDDSFTIARRIKMDLPVNDAGISGMDYDEERDILFLTLSSEATLNAYDDGLIGESFLAAVPNAKQALEETSLTVPSVYRLSDLHDELKTQKIESVSLMGRERKLLLVADDDQGNTKFFTLEF